MAAVQIGPEPSTGKASENTVERLVGEAAEEGAEFLCFPEHWLGEEDQESVSQTIELMKELAQKFNVTIITGGFYEEFPDGTYVTAPVVDSRGQLVGRQRKIHLFGNEKSKATPGSEYTLFDVNNVKFGVMICYDTVFPEVARIFALEEAETIFVPSRILNMGIQPWHLYLSARCLENRLPLVAPNLVLPPQYSGHSIILDLGYDTSAKIVYPNAISTGGESFEILVADIDLENSRRLRKSRLAERRPNIYRAIAES